MATIAPVTNANGLTFDYLSNSIGQVVQTKEAELRTLVASTGANPSTADLLSLQQQVQQWTLMTQVQSTVIKEVSDALKGIVQKTG